MYERASIPWKPTNRHLLVEPTCSKKNKDNKETSILLPEDFSPVESRFLTATVLSIASDCSADLKGSHGQQVVIDSSMMIEVVLESRTYHLILENYVLAISTEEKR